MALFYLAYRYNILFVTDNQIDTKGLIYPRALQHLLTGIYLSEVCMIGLFGIAQSYGPLVLMVIFLVFTVLFHISMNSALDPLLYNLPKSLEAEEEALMTQVEEGTHDPEAASPNEKDTNGVVVAPVPHAKPGMFAKFFKPHIYSDYATLRRLVPHDFADVDSLYTPEIERNAYVPPSVASPTPLLWIPKDAAGVSAEEVAHTSKVIPITDEGASLDEKCHIIWDPEGTRPPIWEDKTYY
jgi:calcium permeable stress-gated cation channel